MWLCKSATVRYIVSKILKKMFNSVCIELVDIRCKSVLLTIAVCAVLKVYYSRYIPSNTPHIDCKAVIGKRLADWSNRAQYTLYIWSAWSRAIFSTNTLPQSAAPLPCIKDRSRGTFMKQWRKHGEKIVLLVLSA